MPFSVHCICAMPVNFFFRKLYSQRIYTVYNVNYHICYICSVTNVCVCVCVCVWFKCLLDFTFSQMHTITTCVYSIQSKNALSTFKCSLYLHFVGQSCKRFSRKTQTVLCSRLESRQTLQISYAIGECIVRK